jgi:spermidine synthase
MPLDRWYRRLGLVHPFTRWMALSGIAALIYEIMLQKLFTYVLGGSLMSTTIVISCYMAGLSLGSLFAGMVGDRLRSRRTVLRTYALLETLIGVCGVGGLLLYLLYQAKLPDLLLVPELASLYAATWFRACMVIAALLPITTLMGATLPILGKAIFLGPPREGSAKPEDAASAKAQEAPSKEMPVLAQLYAANLLGALLGTLIAAYVVLPYLGLWGACIAACIANLAIARSALRASAVVAPPEEKGTSKPAPATEGTADSAPISPALGLLLSFVSGLALFALEILWTHLLAAVIGTSVYAFSNMLLAVLVALYLAARTEGTPEARRARLAPLVLRGALLLAVTIPLIAMSGFVFSFVGLFDPPFVVRELTRLVVALTLIVPVGYALSRIFPRLLMSCIAVGRESRSIGLLTSVNTAGCLSGLLLARFFLIPVLGSATSLRIIVAVLVLSCVVAAGRHRADLSLGAIAPSWRARLVLLAGLVGFFWPSWYPTWLLSNRNVYFTVRSQGDYHQLLFEEEDPEGGFVTVHRASSGYLDLRTNGKFEGNNSGEMTAQLSFGYLPALAAARTGNAFLVGLGTGTTLKGLGDFPFEHIDIAEMSRPMIKAARTYFADVNGGILEDPRVSLIHDDGRNALALANRRYDVISIEITSIWFAGAANLYSRDFYRAAHLRLEKDGVLVQWLQLHHMRPTELWMIVNTLRSEFPHVALFYDGGQGQMLASDQPISLDWARLQASLQWTSKGIAMTPEALYTITANMLLDEEGVEHLVERGTRLPARAAELARRYVVDSDLWPYLEYATPKGNAMDLREQVVGMLHYEMAPRPMHLNLRNVPPDADAAPVIEATSAFIRGDCGASLRYRDEAAAQYRDGLSFVDKCVPNLAVQGVVARE